MWKFDGARYHQHSAFKRTIVHEKTKTSTCLRFAPALWRWGISKRFNLSFLIVGHTHDDIDQRFSVISNILKRQDILSLKQMLAQVETGAQGRDVAFTSAELLENIWNWSGFIADHLHIENNAWTGTRIPHHFWFYVQNNESRVQYKIYCTDVWAPEGRYSAMKSVYRPHGQSQDCL